ncbi:FlgD-like flagellar basal-body rod modification protein [Octadecabacter antarcticus 307]|uniref:Basal-body rod modification protein FlgD n=1 Tax=Octadecabacter antarcticus 307 TaxID=391626 RepID=M9R8K1_9RHOB|nr:flagellar hook capping FlgD N-terminal domain-containing protein [Octadecabacter antarcticus]AGI68547.1 FlgD-like flagellar basal-body rod modification protein [Octadecabacter antarcticus 307]
MDVNSNSQSAQNALLSKLGISTTEERNAEPKDELGQSDFLKLMTAQLQNQDPFAPMDNGDFVAQMAQFSSVAGISEMNQTMSSIAGQMSQFQVASSVNMLGHSVMMPGNIARADNNGEIQGTLDLASASLDTQIEFLDAQSGESLHTLNLGSRASGLSGFEWAALPTEYRDGSRSIRMNVSVNYGDGQGVQSLTPNVFAEVIGASSSAVNGEAMLEVEDYGDVSAADILRFRL